MIKRLSWIVLIVIILVSAEISGRLVLMKNAWIKDQKGVWIKHGQPRILPDYVTLQEKVLAKATELYDQKRAEGIDFSSGPCLADPLADYPEWAVDIAHNPRQEIDNNPENQCSSFRTGKAKHFVELDENGNLIKVF